MKKLSLFLILFVIVLSSSVFAQLSSRMTPACIEYSGVTKRCESVDTCEGISLIEYHIYNEGGKTTIYYIGSDGVFDISFEQGEEFEIKPGEMQVIIARVNTTGMNGSHKGYVLVSSEMTKMGSMNVNLATKSSIHFNISSDTPCFNRVSKTYGQIKNVEDEKEKPRYWIPVVIILGLISIICLVVGFWDKIKEFFKEKDDDSGGDSDEEKEDNSDDETEEKEK